MELKLDDTLASFQWAEWRQDELDSLRSDSISDGPQTHKPKERHRYTFRLVYQRCPSCPFHHGDTPARRTEWRGESPCRATDPNAIPGNAADPHPLPAVSQVVIPDLDQTADQQFQAWLAQVRPPKCGYASRPVPLEKLRQEMFRHFPSYDLRLVYSGCPQCWMERHGIAPEDAGCSFENFTLEPPVIREHWETCQLFAANPQGVLLMLGSTGNGKTHLAYAIMREMFKRGTSDCVFIKQRHFLERHWLARRPAAFDQEPPKDILQRCQRADLLIFDEMREAVGNRDIEDPLLDLFEYRIGHRLPTVITANLKKTELESAIGTRLLDRLRQANFALLEFNFPSRRAIVRRDYLARCAARKLDNPTT